MTQAHAKKHPSPGVSSPAMEKPLSPIFAPALHRSRTLHWLAWGGALVSIAIAALWMWSAPNANLVTLIQGVDVALALFFAAEFFTRTGWQKSRLTYVKWRWFDFVAIVPITALGPLSVPAVFWIVFVCRAIRLVDRTLGDGFVQSKVIALASIAEEEISDRVLVKMLARWERELETAHFGAAMAQALSRNKEAVLQRVYAEQLQDGTFAKIAHFSGLQSTLEKEERRLFSAVIEMVGSHEVDAAIRDVIASSLRRTRQQLSAQDWRRNLATPLALADDLVGPRRAAPTVGARERRSHPG